MVRSSLPVDENELTRELADIRTKIEHLNLPTAAYAGIGISADEYYIAIIEGDKTITVKDTANQHSPSEITEWLAKYTNDNNIKIIAAAVCGNYAAELGARLWLEHDIVPFVTPTPHGVTEAVVQDAARAVPENFDENNLVIVPVTDNNEVGISYLVSRSDYEQTVSPTAWQYLQHQLDTFTANDNYLLFINATPQGGGVALMRHALLRLFRLFDVDVHWHVLQPNHEVFEITKTKFHNILQAVAPAGTALTDKDKDIYQAWVEENAERLRDPIREARVIVIDDPQPSGLIPHIKHLNPQAKIIYRSHIQLDRDLIATEGTAQHTTWQFITSNIQKADLFVSHPIPQFIPREVVPTALTMPATTDPLDGLNKELSSAQLDYYLKLFNKILLEHDQQPLDETRPYIIQIARFDPSKGIPDVIESFRLLRERLRNAPVAPQLVLVGHGSVDDPDGVPVYNMVLNLLREEPYRHLLDDIKVVRLHHNDQILNALLRRAKVALQLSHKEGFEVKVSEALTKGKPVIAYRTGGIPLQITDEKNGYLVDVRDCDTVATHLYNLLTDDQLYQRLSDYAAHNGNPNHFTVYNAIKWLYLANQLCQNEPLPGNSQAVIEVIGEPLKY